ncbi:hypothetical protein HNQ51_000937 [Inhella inkyongensis]|uniref:Uncharacterized protein n=1 Tax=Inhella inkyongensis TaxID=392593 RepID=A0A840S4A4_9BURK|nr:hypothetical protein [Inhella inkyongensis]MBB5203644.1 hypothetical protein [Inhella inkyongensis]
MKPIHTLTPAWQRATPMDQLRALRRAALALREELLDEPALPFYRSLDLIRLPYPTYYAYSGVFAQQGFKFPFVQLQNRVFVLRYVDFEGRARVLLFSPSDHQANRATPFFAELARSLPEALHPWVAPVTRSVEEALTLAGVRPEEVDYLSFDHLHTQDLRRWLGPQALFPKAKLLVQRAEWLSVQGLLPLQAQWYCPQGCEGLNAARIELLDGSVRLGPGLALIHTPGHTAGNHSLVVRAPDGLRVTSENGVSADCYAPEHSRSNALRRFAQRTGQEVILNGNTLEGSTAQYQSMVLEKTLAGPAPDTEFPYCVPSSERCAFWAFPGEPVSHFFGERGWGQ